MVENWRGLAFSATAALGAANATLRPAIAAVEESSVFFALSGGFGISAIVWFSLTLAIAQLTAAEGKHLSQRDFVIIGLALCGFLIPSSTISWLTLAAFGLGVAAQSKTTRQGALILVAVALREPVTALLLAIYAQPILEFDTQFVAALLSLISNDVSSKGNIVVGPGGHRLIILSGCASLTNLSMALLFWYCVTQTFQPKISRRRTVSCLGIFLSVPAINYLRLALMAQSSAWYEYFHVGAGATIAMLLLTVSVFR